MTGFGKLEQKAMRLREAIIKELETGGHRPAFVKLLTRSAEDAEEIHARMGAGRMLLEDDHPADATTEE